MTTAASLARALLGRGKHHASQRAASAASVSIHVRNVAQMFNSLDPSPFWDRDLDPEAAEFIEDEFSEKLSAHTWHLHVHAQEGAALAGDLQAAIEHYYERLATSARRRLRDEMRVAQLALLGGVTIFLVSMTIRGILAGLLPGRAPHMLDEGLIIIAWLALWRPVETLLYGWVPLYRRRRLYERLGAVRASVRMETEGTHVEHAAGAAREARAAS
ncbi:MAG TPA: hypothetical protein VGR86_04540 [Steroidobacteraceae bacterium]|nr:hypothetical protein [Steroidobacteraceae bacterium]